MAEYVIEKGVPLPEESPHSGRRASWSDSLSATFLRMEKGDSIVSTRSLQAISSASCRSGVSVTSRREGGGYRVWRTS